MIKKYSSNNYDCAGYILEKLGWNIARENLPHGWQNSQNCLLENIAKLLKNGEIKPKIKAIILKQEALKPGDICFMRMKAKYVHHLAICLINGHIEHCLPGRGVCRDYLRKNSFLFRFGVRLEQVWVG